MQFEFWYTLVIFVVLSGVLIKELIPTELAMFSALILLILGQVITVKEAFSGFSNEGMLTIAMLFVIAGAIQSTGILEKIDNIIMGKPEQNVSRKLLRSLFPIAGLSAFINNTPIVAVMIPAVKTWCEKNNLSISKFLIPISFAAITGGLCTLIGTSTNLIVHGLLLESGQSGFEFFELTPFGIPLAFITILYLVLFAERFLPERKSPIMELGEHSREFVIELKITEEFPYIGKSIEAAGLRHLKGLYLFQIERNQHIITPTSPNEKLQLGDRLFFTGLPKTILELQKTAGLQLLKDSHFDLKYYDSDEIQTYEAVISKSSELIGKNVRESNFRKKYSAVIIAIHRNGERINQKIGDVYLQAGDTLLILSEKDFKQKWYNSREFYLISKSDDVPSKPIWQAVFAPVVFLTAILLSAFHIISLITAVGITVVLLFLTKSISDFNAVAAVDWKGLIIIACSFGIAIGIKKSLVSDVIADYLAQGFYSFGIIGMLAAVYTLTTIYTNFITNNTAAVLMFPIAISTALALGTQIHPFAIAVALGASSSFATPISYQTNLMVYGPGGYKFTDYIKIGLPLQFLFGISAVTLIYLYYYC